MSDHSDATRDG